MMTTSILKDIEPIFYTEGIFTISTLYTPVTLCVKPNPFMQIIIVHQK